MTRALLVVDVQNDFCEGGSLAVQGGAAVAAAISRHLQDVTYDHVVASRDHHVQPGAHFSDTPDFRDTWPPHCVAGTPGASFHPDLDVAPLEAVFDKGRFTAAYSGFEGAEPGGSALGDWLAARGVDEVEIAGLTTDYCVRTTALDAVRLGLRVTVLTGLCAGVARETSERAMIELRGAGARIG